MKRKDIRRFFQEFFLVKPEKKWEAIAYVWERAIFLGWSALLNWVALITGNGFFLVMLYSLVVIVFFIIYFFVAKGK